MEIRRARGLRADERRASYWSHEAHSPHKFFNWPSQTLLLSYRAKDIICVNSYIVSF